MYIPFCTSLSRMPRFSYIEIARDKPYVVTNYRGRSWGSSTQLGRLEQIVEVAKPEKPWNLQKRNKGTCLTILKCASETDWSDCGWDIKKGGLVEEACEKTKI